MNEEVLKSYEELKRNRNIINTIEPDFFFEIVDCLLKENEKLKALDSSNSKMIANMSKRHFQDREKIRNSIPIQKVKDKIEELNRKIDKSIDNSKGGLDEEFIEKAGELLTQKRILQELLEKEK